MADEAVNVTSDMHAIMWSYTGVSPTTTRVRLTFIYTREAKGISPVQGLIEQWKNEGWTVIDEYVDGYQDFGEIDDFRAHLLEMTRSFLLGVPFGSEVQGDNKPPKEPIKRNGLKPKGSISSRLDSIIKKTTEDKSDNDKNIPDEDDIYAKGVYVKPERADIKLNPSSSSDADGSDDDDDEWI
tara:strand:+ start:1737 stop:2285 length:549 start_codon:yes stop_codon:yes gene_type:complete